MKILSSSERPSALVPDQVHVWMARVEDSGRRIEDLLDALPPGDIERANRFRFEEDRLRSLLAVGMVRTLLGGYLGLDPREVAFSIEPHGRPFVQESLNPSGVDFNLSHSGDWVLGAFALGRRVGVDVEWEKRELPRMEKIARRYFAEEEVAHLMEVPEERRHSAFFRLWTRKEALIKCHGGGLLVPLDSFSVLEDRAFFRNGSDTRAWRLSDLSVEGSYRAALAVEGDPAPRIECGEFSPRRWGESVSRWGSGD
ncbi:MAG: 4'-phosphopantetheinyl transferase superfamily protein [Candidatus Omnitrophica bacterium]|nr:4'-phosphopantetheinyl transferase superfamily protein [Candidatus Omnitrophota bacterium]